ncbi:unnamed protein product, partial [Gulo gulo]
MTLDSGAHFQPWPRCLSPPNHEHPEGGVCGRSSVYHAEDSREYLRDRGTVLESMEGATLNKNTTDALPSALGGEELGTSGEPEGFLRTLGLYPSCPFYRWISRGSGSSRAQGQIHSAIPFPDLDLSLPQRAAAGLKASALRSSLPPYRAA